MKKLAFLGWAFGLRSFPAQYRPRRMPMPRSVSLATGGAK
jgi:hypothetical protein